MARSTSEHPAPLAIRWPDGKDFAFTIFDDTEGGFLDRVRPIYDLLRTNGLRTTKSVWMFDRPDAPTWWGPSCEDEEYLRWLRPLQQDGFEIGYHGPACTSSDRDTVVAAIRRFAELFGPNAITYTNHAENAEAIYWGSARFSGPVRWLYLLLTCFGNRRTFTGHIEHGSRFWGDVCKESIAFVRNFVFADINTLRMCPLMPYYDSTRPFVNAWFASSNGKDADQFVRLLGSANQARLEREHGACIVYTHFGKGFVKNGEIRADCRERIEELSSRNGWFVPVGELLSYLQGQHGGVHPIRPSERRRLEWLWLWHKLFRKGG